jgi:hypothetical protein
MRPACRLKRRPQIKFRPYCHQISVQSRLHLFYCRLVYDQLNPLWYALDALVMQQNFMKQSALWSVLSRPPTLRFSDALSLARSCWLVRFALAAPIRFTPHLCPEAAVPSHPTVNSRKSKLALLHAPHPGSKAKDAQAAESAAHNLFAFPFWLELHLQV